MQIVPRENLRYTLAPDLEPVCRVAPGERFVVETDINVGDAMRTATDRLGPGSIDWPYVNPVTGPIHVETAKPGDVLAINMIDIEIVPPVYCALVPGWSAFTSWFGRKDFGYHTRVVEVRDGYIHWNDRLRFPAKPMLGTIGVAPALEAPLSVDNGRHGGNMDVQEVGTGNTLYLPCSVDGGMLYLGDAQAHQGDGELACTSIETRSRAHLSIEVAPKPGSMTWPRLEGPDFLMTIVPAHPLEDAFRTAFQELVFWVEERFAADRSEVYMLLGQTVEARATQICNPKPTYVCKIRKSYLEALRP